MFNIKIKQLREQTFDSFAPAPGDANVLLNSPLN